MAAIDNVNAALLNVTALIEQITANPEPNYSINGVSISWSEYLGQLTKQLEALQEASIYLTGPYELVSQGIS